MQKLISSRLKCSFFLSPIRSFGTVSNPKYLDPNHTRMILLGCGFSGLTVAAHIPRITDLRKFDIRAFDSQSSGYFTPSMDLIPFEIRTAEELGKPILKVLSESSAIEFSEVEHIDPENHMVLTENKQFKYDYLVLALGLIPNYSKINGLKEALDDRDIPVVSTATLVDAEKCRKEFEIFYTGNVIFYNDKKAKTYASGLNLSMLFDEYLRGRKGGLRSLSNISYITNDVAVFPDEKYDEKIKKILSSKQINYDCQQFELIEIDKHTRKAVFLDLKTQEKVEKEFDLLVVNPEFVLPPIISSLSKNDGYLDIDSRTFVHNKYPNIFGVGHCARDEKTIITHKTVVEQSLIMCANLQLDVEASSKTESPSAYVHYTGKTSVPIFIGDKKCLVAQLDPENPNRSLKEPSTSSYLKEVYMYQKLYFGLLTQGMWFGDTGLRVPHFSVTQKNMGKI